MCLLKDRGKGGGGEHEEMLTGPHARGAPKLTMRWEFRVVTHSLGPQERTLTRC